MSNIYYTDHFQDMFDQWCEEHDLPTGLDPYDILKGSDLTNEEEKIVKAFETIWNEL